MPSETRETIEWSAYEHEHVHRDSNWFWALGVIAVCAALSAILFENFLFALLILLAATVLGLMANRPPILHDFVISERGIRAGDELHTYDEIISFWVDEELEEPLLLIDTTKFMSPNLVIPIDGIAPERIREYLRERVEEVPMKEPLAHKILEFFGL